MTHFLFWAVSSVRDVLSSPRSAEVALVFRRNAFKMLVSVNRTKCDLSLLIVSHRIDSTNTGFRL